MDIVRQHDSTTIHELAGARFTKLLAVGPGKETGFHVWYLQADGVWYRFFINCGVLFWGTSAPDPDDDLADDEDYEDIAGQHDLGASKTIKLVQMSKGCLKISFFDGPELSFREIEESGGMSVAESQRQ